MNRPQNRLTARPTIKNGGSGGIPRSRVQKEKGNALKQVGVSERIAEEKKSSWIKNKRKDHIH